MARTARERLQQKLDGYRQDILAARRRLDDWADDEALHDLRNGLRRLHSLLTVLMALPGGKRLSVLRLQLRELGRQSNVWRDREVRLQQLCERAGQADSPAFAAWREREQQQLHDARPQWQQQYGTPLDAALMPLAPLSALVLAVPNRILQQNLHKSLRRIRRRFRRARQSWCRKPADAAQAHRLRLRAKQLRYQIEACDGLFGNRWQQRALRAAAWQQQLGEARDGEILLQSVQGEAIPLPTVVLQWFNQQREDRLAALVQLAQAC